MTYEQKLARWQVKLADVRREQQRQIGFAGERLGVFASLRELGREERRIVRQIEKLTEQPTEAQP